MPGMADSTSSTIVREITSDVFAPSEAAYAKARRQLRERIGVALGVPPARFRLAPGSVTIQRRVDADRWLAVQKDVVDQQRWWLRHSSAGEYRLSMRVSCPS